MYVMIPALKRFTSVRYEHKKIKMCKRKVTLKIDFENIDENYIHIFFNIYFMILNK